MFDSVSRSVYEAERDARVRAEARITEIEARAAQLAAEVSEKSRLLGIERDAKVRSEAVRERVESEAAELRRQVARLNGLVGSSRQQHIDEMKQAREQHSRELREMAERHERATTDLLDRLNPKPEKPSLITGETPRQFLSTEQLGRMPAVGKRGLREKTRLMSEAKARETEEDLKTDAEKRRDALAPEELELVDSAVVGR